MDPMPSELPRGVRVATQQTAVNGVPSVQPATPPSVREETASRMLELLLTLAVAGVILPGPAGTFDTIRIVCNNTRNNAWVITVWYSPEVNHIVKDEYPVRTGGRTSRELMMFRLK